MSLQRSKTTVPYQVIPAKNRSHGKTTTNVPGTDYAAVIPAPISIPQDTLERIYKKMKQAERPLVSFQDDQGEMFMEAFRLRERIIKEIIQELEPYV
jgi:hypothetical protein